jgi:hypothetical protein
MAGRAVAGEIAHQFSLCVALFRRRAGLAVVGRRACPSAFEPAQT